jgi:transposase
MKNSVMFVSNKFTTDMSAKFKSMHQIRQIFQLYLSGKRIRNISRLTGISRNTVKQYLGKVSYSEERIRALLSENDEVLQAVLQSSSTVVGSFSEGNRHLVLLSLLAGYCESLQSTGVTRKLLWSEYRAAHKDGYGYTQFCEHLMRYNRQQKAVMRFSSRAGEELQVDFAGKKLSYTDLQTGQTVFCEVLICVLTHSHYMFAIALASQKQAYFISGLSACLTYLGGVPQSIKCDNLRAAVQRSHRYEPEFTEAMDLLAAHYQTSIVAARVRKPRDKASVEKAVDIAYQRIYAPLRQHTFYSLEELNAAILRQLAWHNEQLFQGKDYSRKQLFEQEEKPLLGTLPPVAYELKEVCQAKVQTNYHVLLGKDKHYYSVPYTLIGKRLKIVYSLQVVEIYNSQLQRVAIHPRNTRPNAYTTLAEHMPAAHQHIRQILQLQPADFEQKAQQVGTATLSVMQNILRSGKFWKNTHSSCLGLLRLQNKYGKERLEVACQRALICPKITCKTVQNILQNNLDKQPLEAQTTVANLLPEHEQIRGPQNYQ